MRSAANCEADRHGVRGRSAAGSGAAACAIAMSKSCWPSGGIEVDHVTMYRWVQTLTPEFIHAARPARPATGDRWSSMRPTSKVAGRWTYLYRAVDRHGQAINVRVSYRRDAAAAREFFVRALRCGSSPTRCPATRLPRIPGCGRGRNSAARKERDSRGHRPRVSGAALSGRGVPGWLDVQQREPAVFAHPEAGDGIVARIWQ
jgi:hypothetical protein